jgi:hypothetical protein
LQVKKQTGKEPEGLRGPRFPELMENTWSAFIALSNSRNPSMSGVAPITYQQIESFMSVTKTRLTPREIETIKALDLKYLEIMNE